MLSAQQRSELERLGLTRVPSAFPADAAARMCEHLWDALARRHGIAQGARATWTVEEPRHLQALRHAHAFDAIASPQLLAVLDEVLGADAWQRPKQWGVPLVTFPRDGVWHVPHQRWHFDWPVCGAARPLPGLKVLAFLAPVEAGGGGTLVLAGSHQLVERSTSPDAPPRPGRAVRTALLASHPWLAELASATGGTERTERLLRGAVIDGVEAHVAELTGSPGDVVLLHPWMLHAAAPNCGSAPRMMVGENVQTARGLALYAGSVP